MAGVGVQLQISIHYEESEVDKLEVFECGKLFLHYYLEGGVYGYTCFLFLVYPLGMEGSQNVSCV